VALSRAEKGALEAAIDDDGRFLGMARAWVRRRSMECGSLIRIGAHGGNLEHATGNIRNRQQGKGPMEHFEDSVGGRLLTLAVIVPLAAGASVTWDDGGGGTIAIMGAVAVGTVLATLGGGIASAERTK